MNHDYSISKNFWGYVKKIFNIKAEMLPSFSMDECFDYFTRTLSSLNPTRLFNLRSWMPTLSDPVIPFNLEPPTYQQISNVIRKMKASGSPCQSFILKDVRFFAPIYLKLSVQLGQLDPSQANGRKPAQSSSTRKETLMTLPTFVQLPCNLCP